jgi:hypothetical protein
MSDIKYQLNETFKSFNQLRKVETYLLELNNQLAREYAKLEAFGKVVDQHKDEVDKLEKMSVKGIFYKVLGNKEQQLEKDRQEYLDAFLKYNEAEKAVELMEFERKTLEKKLKSKGPMELKLARLIKKREKELLKENPKTGGEIINIQKQIEHQQKMQVEVSQALQVGNQASKVLTNMLKYLQQAQNWGQWDMAGRRRMADYHKHSAMDRAKALSHEAQKVLIRFKAELKDVYNEVNFSFKLKFDDVSKFTDIFFDNIISDWLVQQKIVTSLKNVALIKKQVDHSIRTLNAELPRIEKAIEKLEVKKEKLILKS